MMNRKLYKKVLILSVCAIFMLIGCGKEDKPEPDPNPVVVPDDNPDVPDEPTYPDIEPESDETYRLRTDVSDEYRDRSLQLGDKVDVPNRQGYTFHGYYDGRHGEGVQYIDKSGKLVKEYHGTDKPLVLWTYYTPNEYRITICENGVPLTECSALICAYDEKINDDLPWGKVIKKNRKVDNDESYTIIGFVADDYKLALENNENTLRPKDLEKYADHNEQTLALDVITSDITYLWQNLDTRKITNKGYLEQKVDIDKNPYDYFSIAENIDLEALKELGYKDVKIKLTVAVGKGKGTPTVSVMTKKAGKTKTIEEKAIIDTGKIEKKELNELGEFVHSYTVSIKKLSDDFFVYYNSDNWGSDTWSCDAITMELEFVK